MVQNNVRTGIVGLLAAILFGQVAAAADADTARYRIEIVYEWSAETHPVDFPERPHFSRLIATTHNSRYALFSDGRTASSGVALVATNGRVTVLEAELAEARRRGRVDQVLVAPGQRADAGPLALEIEVAADHPLLSFVTMLAPSPDWFTGAHDVALRKNDRWVETVSAPLWVWDAGVDAGAAYDSPNAPMQPQESVRLAAGPQFLQPTGLARVGWATVTRLAPEGSGDD